MRVSVVLALALAAAAPQAPPDKNTAAPSPPAKVATQKVATQAGAAKVATQAGAAKDAPAPGGKAGQKPSGEPGEKASAKPADKRGPPAPPSLLVAMPAGAPAEAILHLLLKPYSEAGGLAISQTEWSGAADGQAKPDPAKQKPDPAPDLVPGLVPSLVPDLVPDLVLVSGAQLAAGCKAQSLNRLDWGRLGRDRYQPEAASDCGVGAYKETTVLAWDQDKLAGTPGWSDFWDVARHPGRRGLPRSARFTLEVALLADGVSPGDVYRTLRAADGQDRAFRKLDQLKPYIVWWDKPADAAQMLAAGRVLLTATPAAPVLRLASGKRHFGVQWAGSLAVWHTWAVPHGAARPQAAALALLVAGDLARQASFAEATFEAPASRDALLLLPAGLQLQAPDGGSLDYDDGFWAENGAKLEARFAAWVAK